MTIAELIKKLNGFDPNMEIMVLDGFNGGGFPRTLNFGPIQRKINIGDAGTARLGENYDCKDKVGKPVVLIGYGCY